MKAYTAPQIVMINNWEELNVEPATLEWALDSEKNQIVVTSRYEKLESEDDEDEYRHFKLRPEAVEVLRVDCDPAEIEIVKEGVDEEGNKFKTIVTKGQTVAFEIGAECYELKECMGFDYEEFDLYMTDVDHYYTVAFRKDGRWWFLELNYGNVGLLGYTYWDDEENDNVEVPFSCGSIHPMNAYEPYVRGEGEYSSEESMIGRELWMICEDGDAQYGVYFDEGCGDVELLNGSMGDGEGWNEIKLIGKSITVSTQEDAQGVKKQWIRRRFFSGVLAAYDRDDEYGVNGDPIEYDILKDRILRIVQGDYLRLYRLEKTFSFDFDMKEQEEELEILRDVKAGLYDLMGMEIKAKADGYFAVKQEVCVGSRKKVQYRIIFEDAYVGDIYDDVELLACGEGRDPLFKVKKDGYWGIINEVGTVVVPLRFTGISAKNDGMTAIDGVSLDYVLTLDEFGRKGWGYLSEKGFVQPIPCEYEHVEASGNGWVIDEICVEKVGRVAVYDLNGRLKEEFKPGRI